MRPEAVIFDFDGTVARTHMGVVNSVVYALNALGAPIPEETTLLEFLGPPLNWSFTELAHLSPADADRAVAKYRERYSETGLFECELYPGFRELLEVLRDAGIPAGIASGKPEVFLKRIVQRLGIASLVSAVAGPSFSDKSPDKTPEILRALPPGAEPSRCVMVGDRRFDIEAGNGLGMKTIGVLYGYGSRQELTASGAAALAETCAEILDRLKELAAQ